MKLLVTGSNGQLGTELQVAARAAGWDVVAMDQDGLDITDLSSVKDAVARQAPDAVVNAAAYTAVDMAENDRQAAFAVNRDGSAHLAEACGVHGVRLLHVSTDYVFDGANGKAYLEDDPTNPLGVYGESKLAGEDAIRAHCDDHVILRTSWVFSAHGKNFVKTMLRLGSEREALGVVADQYGCPTAAAELARGIMTVLKGDPNIRGTFHFCQPEPTTWYDFAAAIFAEASSQGVPLKLRRIKPIATSDYPTPAVRPAHSVLNCARFEAAFGFNFRSWRESLPEIIRNLASVGQ